MVTCVEPLRIQTYMVYNRLSLKTIGKQQQTHINKKNNIFFLLSGVDGELLRGGETVGGRLPLDNPLCPRLPYHSPQKVRNQSCGSVFDFYKSSDQDPYKLLGR